MKTQMNGPSRKRNNIEGFYHFLSIIGLITSLTFLFVFCFISKINQTSFLDKLDFTVVNIVFYLFINKRKGSNKS